MQCLVIFCLFVLELCREPLLQSLQVGILFLQVELYVLCLFACVGVLLQFLLEVVGCSL